MLKRTDRKKKRQAIHRRVRRKVAGTAERPRLSFFKSSSHVYAQLIDDAAGKTLLAVSSLSKDLQGKVPRAGNVAAAKALGEVVAERAAAQKIESAVFDRGGFLYHGAVKAFAEAAREKGLKF